MKRMTKEERAANEALAIKRAIETQERLNLESKLRNDIDILYNINARQISFLESYYTEKTSSTNLPFKIERNFRSATSYYSRHDNTVNISDYNIIEVMKDVKNLAYASFYTILCHEIGHAMYTGDLMYSQLINILEDNRIESNILKWNKRARFALIKYALIDKALDVNNIKTKIQLALYLLRTNYNKDVIAKFSNTPDNEKRIQRILELDKEYTSKEYEFNSKEINHRRLYEIAAIIDNLLEQILNDQPKNGDGKEEDSNGETEETKNKADGSEGKEEPSEQDTNEESEQDTNEESEQDSNNNENGNSSESIKSDDTKTNETTHQSTPEKDILNQLENEMNDALYNSKEVIDKIKNYIYNFNNNTVDKDPYNKYKIGVFTTERQSEIRRSDVETRYVGSAKQLSMQRYSRRDFVSHEKYFDKQTENKGLNGKSASVVFYLDISGSMKYSNKIEIATDYLKSFYDTMNKYINIRMFGFGSKTYSLTRNDLNLDFIKRNLQGSTEPQLLKINKNEEIIIITDGEWGVPIPKEYAEKAHFIIVEAEGSTIQAFKNVKNKTFVNGTYLVKALEEATQSIKRLLTNN